MNLIRYIATNFPGLTLEPPLFYSWPRALRFELNAEVSGLSYFESVHHRAEALYKSAFASGDKVVIASIADRFRGIGRQRRSGYTIFDLSRKRNLGIGRPSGRHMLIRNQEQIEDHRAPKARVVWAEVSPYSIDYEFLLQRIARVDFPTVRFTATRSIPPSDHVYFVNLTRNLIFHMYDDRGLDIIATEKATLQPIYEQHTSWLLQYDIKRMEQTFAP